MVSRLMSEVLPTSSTPAEYLANELERLMALPLATPDDVEQWYAVRHTAEQTLGARFSDFDVEHEVWHFFDDADIRGRDSGYRDNQHGLMCDYVQRLRSH